MSEPLRLDHYQRYEFDSRVRKFIVAGATIDQISDILLKFGAITVANRDDAIAYVFTMLLKGKNRNKRII